MISNHLIKPCCKTPLNSSDLTHTHTHIYTHTQTQTHTHTLTHTHTHIHTQCKRNHSSLELLLEESLDISSTSSFSLLWPLRSWIPWCDPVEVKVMATSCDGCHDNELPIPCMAPPGMVVMCCSAKKAFRYFPLFSSTPLNNFNTSHLARWKFSHWTKTLQVHATRLYGSTNYSLHNCSHHHKNENTNNSSPVEVCVWGGCREWSG